jgi:uncharacterized protein YndB with AHSA1/START domain
MAEDLENGQPVARMETDERGKRTFVIARKFPASPEALFAAWTEEERLKQWFGPAGFPIPVARLNLVPGGTFHYCMRAANGTEMWGKWTFREIVAPERIVFVNTFSNKHGNLMHHPFVPGWPLEMLSTVIFEPATGGTLLTIRWIPIHASEPEHITFENTYEGLVQAWTGTLNQLATYLKTTQDRDSDPPAPASSPA